MKTYKIFDSMQSFANSCKKAANNCAEHIGETKEKLMVKRLRLIDKEQEYLRSQLGRRINSSAPAQR